jgi:glutathione S-transferase
MTLKIIGATRSRTFRALWLAEELGLDYEHLPEMPRSEAVTKLNPLGQIPVLTDGEIIVPDSLAILHYLADKAGRFTYPAGTPARAIMDARINFVLSEMEAPLWMAARHTFVLPEERRHPEIKPWLRDDFADAGRKFEILLGDSEYFAGDSFTIADIIAAHTINWAINAKFEPSDGLRTYLGRISGRPAWERAQAR